MQSIRSLEGGESREICCFIFAPQLNNQYKHPNIMQTLTDRLNVDVY